MRHSVSRQGSGLDGAGDRADPVCMTDADEWPHPKESAQERRARQTAEGAVAMAEKIAEDERTLANLARLRAERLKREAAKTG